MRRNFPPNLKGRGSLISIELHSFSPSALANDLAFG
jgi:hypothetical protein